jgi:hypothetical protein
LYIFTIHFLDNLSHPLPFFVAAMDSSVVKQQLMQKVQVEAQTANLRMLLEVRQPGAFEAISQSRKLTAYRTENPGELLRQMRPQTRNLPLERRADLRHDMHGEVHAGMEPGQLSIHQQGTGRARKPVKYPASNAQGGNWDVPTCYDIIY